MGFLRALNTNYIMQMQMGDSTHIFTDADFQHCAGHYYKLDFRYNAALFKLLKDDIAKGEIFPAIRDNELHFYCKGGCLYKLAKGVFLRDSNYEYYNVH